MISSYKNAIATCYEVEKIWKRKKFFGWERKIEGFAGSKKLSKGALYENSGHLIYDSIRKGGILGDYVVSVAPIIVNPDTKCRKVFEGNSAFIGNLFYQYGHFITEGLSRLYDFENLNSYDNLLMYPFEFDVYNTKLEFYHKYFFKKLGIDYSKIRIIDTVSKIESVVVYKQLWTINESVDKKLSHLYDHLRLNLEIEEASKVKYFLSRKSEVRVENLKEVEEFFKNKSFEIIYPEDLSMEDQMKIYSGNNVIVSFSGSAVHNSIFGLMHSIFVELGDTRTPNEPHPMQQLVNSLSIANYRFVPFSTIDEKSWDLQSLDAILSELNLV